MGFALFVSAATSAILCLVRWLQTGNTALLLPALLNLIGLRLLLWSHRKQQTLRQFEKDKHK
jgi:hypothetical protein